MTLLLIAMTLVALPEEGRILFEEANAAYHAGAYDEAIEQYVRLQRDYDVKSAPLFFNLGNAWYRNGSLGKAILHYEAALAVEPRFEPARKNLDTVLQDTRRRLPAPDPAMLEQGSLVRYYPFSPWHSLVLTHACLLLALALLVVRYWRDTPRIKWMGHFLPALALLFFAFAVMGNQATRTAPKLAVALPDEAPVYFSMSELDSPRFLLYEGDRVLIDRFEGDWARVHAYGGERGWTRRGNTGVVEYTTI